jgi:hypothetical protein
VASVPSDTVALVIRVWREPGVPGFRGRIMSTSDAGDPGIVVRDSEQVHTVVQEWLDRFVQGSAEHGEDELR